MRKRKKELHLQTMERRKEFLIAKQGTPMYNSWVVAELGATEYAIQLITKAIEDSDSAHEALEPERIDNGQET